MAKARGAATLPGAQPILPVEGLSEFKDLFTRKHEDFVKKMLTKDSLLNAKILANSLKLESNIKKNQKTRIDSAKKSAESVIQLKLKTANTLRSIDEKYASDTQKNLKARITSEETIRKTATKRLVGLFNTN